MATVRSEERAVEAAALGVPELAVTFGDAAADVEGNGLDENETRDRSDDDQDGQADELLDLDADNRVFEPVGGEDGEGGEDSDGHVTPIGRARLPLLRSR